MKRHCDKNKPGTRGQSPIKFKSIMHKSRGIDIVIKWELTYKLQINLKLEMLWDCWKVIQLFAFWSTPSPSNYIIIGGGYTNSGSQCTSASGQPVKRRKQTIFFFAVYVSSGTTCERNRSVCQHQDYLWNKYKSTEYTVISKYSAQNTLLSIYIFLYMVAMYKVSHKKCPLAIF